jgi:hypothetical protein
MDTMREQENNRHWGNGDLLQRLYGLAPEGGVSEEHLASCGECSGRWEALRLARAETLSAAGIELVPEARLLRQRRALWVRIDHPRQFWFSRWAPAAATAMMLAVGFVLLHPGRPLAVPASQSVSNGVASISDAELFSELSVMASPASPQAAEPIRALFESSSVEEEEGSY